jgi:hypothetical protein
MPKLNRYPRLNRYITIQSRDAGRGVGGSLEPVWDDLFTNVPACRQDEQGSRYDTSVSGQQVNNTLRTYFTVRWTAALAALDGSQRIVHEGRIFKLCGQPIEPDVMPGRTYLQFFAEAGAAKL